MTLYFTTVTYLLARIKDAVAALARRGCHQFGNGEGQLLQGLIRPSTDHVDGAVSRVR